MPVVSVIFLVFLILVPVGLFVWLLLGTDVFTVQSITVVDARDHTMGEARLIVEEGMANLPLNKNIFFVKWIS